MSLYTYDLHVHSCLSPCADNDNTPNNLAGMATLNNIQIMALTDHNSCRNCPAFFTAAKRYGIIPIPGMELTTSEDIHVICLFPDLQSALDFKEEDFLTNATEISYEEVPELVDRYGGACYPAHIDREANGVIAILGTLPEEPDYPCAELHFMKNVASYTKEFHLENKRVIVSSDAHYLEDLREENDTIEIPDEPYSSDLVRRNLIRILRGEKL